MADDSQPRPNRAMTSKIIAIAIAVWLMAVSAAYYAELWTIAAPLMRRLRIF